MKRAGLFLMSFLIAAGLAGGATAQSRAKIRVIHDNTSHAAIPYVAEKKGFYKAEGLEVERRITEARGLTDAIVSRTADFVSTRGSRVGQIAARGFSDVVAVALNRYGNQNMVLVPMKDKTTKTMKDLVGKRIGAQFGTGTWATWVTYLSKVGLSEKDFIIKNIKTDSLPAAFATGELEGGLTWEPWGSIIIDKGLGRPVMGPEDYERILGYTSPVFFASTWGYIQKQNPEGSLRFIRAHVRAMRFVNTQRDETARLMVEFWRSQGLDFPLETVKRDLYRLMRWDRAMITHDDIREIQDDIDLSVQKGRMPKRVDFRGHVDISLVEKAYFELMK